VFVSKWGTRGTRGTGDGELYNPGAVAVASDGSVYVSDTNNSRIQKFTSEGVFVTKFGSNGLREGEFDDAWSVAVAPDGSFYVADMDNHRIQKFSPVP